MYFGTVPWYSYTAVLKSATPVQYSTVHNLVKGSPSAFIIVTKSKVVIDSMKQNYDIFCTK